MKKPAMITQEPFRLPCRAGGINDLCAVIWRTGQAQIVLQHVVGVDVDVD